MTYGELWAASEAIAARIGRQGLDEHAPIMVYGHKSPLMVACFLACLKCGSPYVPVDCHSVPVERVGSIAAQLAEPLVLATLGLPEAARGAAPMTCLGREELEACVAEGGSSRPEAWVAGEDLAYILFTSGSTGTPKGVEVTASCMDNFAGWALTLAGEPCRGRVYLDQAPFSFDLSVFELTGALMSGGSLFSLTHATQASVSAQFEALASSGVNVWVSTPSFADLCLADPSFGAELLPNLETFLFCGETLTNKTARSLMDRFGSVRVINTYGPTESTVAVTSVVVTRELADADEPLPVGAPRPGTELRIVGVDGACVPADERGEVVIVGDTVARGYHGRPDLTERSFGSAELAGAPVRSYRTGDEGYLDDEGMLHYHGRIDLQVKLNGFRIELGDIEEHLMRLPGVKMAAVVPAERDGRIAHLVAHVVWEGVRAESDFRLGLALKEQLKANLPHYMIPKRIAFHDALPTTPNGKVDRKALKALSSR